MRSVQTVKDLSFACAMKASTVTVSNVLTSMNVNQVITTVVSPLEIASILLVPSHANVKRVISVMVSHVMM